MKPIKISLLLLIISISISCDKEEEPEPITIAQDLQNGFWVREPEPNEFKTVIKLDGTTLTIYGICTDGINAIGCVQGAPPCIFGSSSFVYTLEGNIMTGVDNNGNGPEHGEPP